MVARQKRWRQGKSVELLVCFVRCLLSTLSRFAVTDALKICFVPARRSAVSARRRGEVSVQFALHGRILH